MDPIKNDALVAVSTGYAAGATTIVLTGAEGAKLPDPAVDGPFNLVWWNATDYKAPHEDPNRERIRVTARNGDTLTIVRAQEGTSDVTHNTISKQYMMALVLSKKMYDDLDYAIEQANLSMRHLGKGIELNGVDEYCYKTAPTGIDFNGTDKITNGGFETHTGTVDDGITDTFTGWTNSALGTSIIEATATSKSGTRAIKITKGDTQCTISQSNAVVANTRHSLVVWNRGDGTNAGLIQIIDDQSGQYLQVDGTWAAAVYSFAGTTSITYARKAVNFTSKITATTITLRLVANATNGSVVYFDDVEFREAYDGAVMFWFRPESNGEQYLLSYGGVNKFGIGGFHPSTPQKISASIIGVVSLRQTNNDLVFGQVYFVAVTITGGIINPDSVNLYINGILDNGPALSIGDNHVSQSSALYIGQAGNNSAYQKGLMGEVQIVIKRTFSANDIYNAYRYSIPRKWNAGSVGAYLPWEGDTDLKLLRDISGSGNNLTGNNVTIADQVTGAAPYYVRVIETDVDGNIFVRRKLTIGDNL